MLGERAPDSWSVTVGGRGARLIGGALTTQVDRREAEELVLDGFFPQVAADAAPARGARAGLQEFGLPYASDPAVTDTRRTSRVAPGAGLVTSMVATSGPSAMVRIDGAPDEAGVDGSRPAT